MEAMMVQTESKTYPIYIENAFATLPEAVKRAGLQGRRAVIVTDTNVAALYLDEVRQLLGAVLDCAGACVFEAGEAHKTLVAIEDMYACFMRYRLDRKSVIIALGGWVAGDMAGFAAATYMRGIPFIQIPTTLLSQVDSSSGGKTGVDFGGGKNLIGAFHQPELVYINTETLRTLPREQVISGMGEVVKHGLILDAAYFNYLAAHADDIERLDAEVMKQVVLGSCKIKAGVVAEDERESGLREILNYGHTFGHAVESAYEFRLPHGHCVVLGIVCAMRFAVEAGIFTEEERQAVADVLRRFGFPVRLPADVPKPGLEAMYELMLSDKKTRSQRLNLVLPEGIGKVRRVQTDDCEAVLRALKEID